MIWILVGLLAIELIGLFLYMALAFYHRAVIAWCDEREALFVQVFQAARVILGRQHQFTADVPLDNEENGWANRNARRIYFNGHVVNYPTLIDMVMTEQDQRKLLEVAMDHVALFELEHPLPRPPRLLELTHLV